eukprot:PhF_6_TR42635/c0_g1_i1/m.64124
MESKYSKVVVDIVEQPPPAAVVLTPITFKLRVRIPEGVSRVTLMLFASEIVSGAEYFLSTATVSQSGEVTLQAQLPQEGTFEMLLRMPYKGVPTMTRTQRIVIASSQNVPCALRVEAPKRFVQHRDVSLSVFLINADGSVVSKDTTYPVHLFYEDTNQCEHHLQSTAKIIRGAAQFQFPWTGDAGKCRLKATAMGIRSAWCAVSVDPVQDVTSDVRLELCATIPKVVEVNSIIPLSFHIVDRRGDTQLTPTSVYVWRVRYSLQGKIETFLHHVITAADGCAQLEYEIESADVRSCISFKASARGLRSIETDVIRVMSVSLDVSDLVSEEEHQRCLLESVQQLQMCELVTAGSRPAIGLISEWLSLRSATLAEEADEWQVLISEFISAMKVRPDYRRLFKTSVMKVMTIQDQTASAILSEYERSKGIPPPHLLTRRRSSGLKTTLSTTFAKRHANFRDKLRKSRRASNTLAAQWESAVEEGLLTTTAVPAPEPNHENKDASESNANVETELYETRLEEYFSRMQTGKRRRTSIMTKSIFALMHFRKCVHEEAQHRDTLVKNEATVFYFIEETYARLCILLEENMAVAVLHSHSHVPGAGLKRFRMAARKVLLDIVTKKLNWRDVVKHLRSTETKVFEYIHQEYSDSVSKMEIEERKNRLAQSQALERRLLEKRRNRLSSRRNTFRLESSVMMSRSCLDGDDSSLKGEDTLEGLPKAQSAKLKMRRALIRNGTLKDHSSGKRLTEILTTSMQQSKSTRDHVLQDFEVRNAQLETELRDNQRKQQKSYEQKLKDKQRQAHLKKILSANWESVDFMRATPSMANGFYSESSLGTTNGSARTRHREDDDDDDDYEDIEGSQRRLHSPLVEGSQFDL